MLLPALTVALVLVPPLLSSRFLMPQIGSHRQRPMTSPTITQGWSWGNPERLMPVLQGSCRKNTHRDHLVHVALRILERISSRALLSTGLRGGVDNSRETIPSLWMRNREMRELSLIYYSVYRFLSVKVWSCMGLSSNSASGTRTWGSCSLLLASASSSVRWGNTCSKYYRH